MNKYGNSPFKNVSEDEDEYNEQSFDREPDSCEQSPGGNNSYNRSANSSKSYAELSADVGRLRNELMQDGGYAKQTGNRTNTSFEQESSARMKNDSSSTAHNSTLYYNYIMMAIVVIITILASIFIVSSRSADKNEFKKTECPQFKEMSKEFVHQDQQLFKSLKVSIENVINQTPAQPCVFLLAYNDPETSKHLMTKILNATANCMQSQNPIQLEGGTFVTDAMLKDYGEIIEANREPLKNAGILYVSDVNKIPAMAAQAFHSICDAHEPLVSRSVIFFTMYVDQDGQNLSPNQISKLVETQLTSNWDAINHNTLNALVGRVTEQVFLLRSEKGAR